jgi:anthranilate phosphoribosyltransferase
MFAPLYHSATARVAGVRRQLGVHTTFNLLGPLTNPAGATRQVIGVWDRALAEPLARTLALLGTERAWVVHGTDGLDEVTLADSTFVAETENGGVRTFEIKPEDFGLQRSALSNLRGCDAEGNAEIIRDVLNGKRKDQARALVVINAATALYVGGAAGDFREGVRLAEESIDQGLAAEKLDRLIKKTND